MSDTSGPFTMNNNNNGNDGDGGPNLNLLWILIIALWCCYCCRSERQRDDPADDPIGGWIPNPSSNAPPQTIEERREEIEDKLIIRKVISATDTTTASNSSLPDDGDDAVDAEKEKENSSRRNTASMRQWFMERMTKSERTFASYTSALTTRRSPQTRQTIFSEPILRRAQSLPVSSSAPFNPNLSTSMSLRPPAIHEEEENEDDKSQNQDDDNNKDDEKQEAATKDEDDEEMQEIELDPKQEEPKTILHRRKCDIVARTMAQTLRGEQDYDQPTTCDICLLDYEKGEEVAWSKNDACVHAFHKECIVDWLLRNPKCPLCRNDYLHDSHPNEENPNCCSVGGQHNHDHSHATTTSESGTTNVENV